MRTARAVPTPWLCRKTMISRTIFCSAQAAVMRPARTGPIPSTSRRRSGFRLDHVEYLVAEGPQQLLGIDRANAADHAGRQILLDTVDRGRCRCAQKPGLELLAMGAVVYPFTRCRDPFAGGDSCRVADHCHEVPMPPSLRPQNAKAIFCIMKGDALDESRQHLLGR